MRRTLALLLLAAATPLLAQDAPVPAPSSKSTVTLALDEYDVLRRGNERPSTTVIDTIQLAGSFRERGLSIAFTGRATGTRPGVKAIEQANDVTISSCTGDGIVARTAKGSFDLVPLKEAFEVRCELQISGSDRLRMQVPASVLAVRSSVGDGELVAGDEDDAGGRSYVLVRHVAGPGERLAATATGRYLITVLPDATRFRYAIDVHNPNRTTSEVQVTLGSNEHLQQIDSAAPYEVNGTRYVFSIPPGDSNITMSGELRATSFTAPVRANLQYLVIETHPLLRASVQSAAKRVSLGETGLTPQFRGALAFETGTATISWSVTRLEALHSISYAVTNATHAFFIPADGPILGESRYAVRNEGASDLTLPKKPEPTYVAVDDEAMLMTKNRDGRVTLPLSQGDQNALVQHRQPPRRGLGFLVGTIDVPQLPVAASQTYVELRYPDRWLPLYQSFGTQTQFWQPSLGTLMLLLLLAFWCERSLAWLGLGRGRWSISFVAALAATLSQTILWIVAVALLAVTVLWAAIGLRRMKWTAGKMLLAAAGVIGVVFLLLVIPSVGPYRMASKGVGGIASSDGISAENVARVVTDASKTQNQYDAPNAPQQQLQYQGLPAKFDLPAGSRSASFSEELLTTGKVHRVAVVAISQLILRLAALVLALVAAFLLWTQWRTLLDGVRQRTAELNPQPLPPAEVTA